MYNCFVKTKSTVPKPGGGGLTLDPFTRAAPFAAVGKKTEGNALFKEIIDSQKAFAERVVRWELDTVVPRRMAYNHYFAKAAPAAAKKG